MDLFIQAIGFGLVTASVVALGAMGFTLQFGLTNILNLAYGVVLTVGAFAGFGVVNAGGDMWLALLAGGAAACILTLLIGKGFFPFFVRRNIGLIQVVMLTIGLGLVVQYVIESIDRGNFYQVLVPAGRSLHFGPAVLTTSEIIIIVIAAVVYVALAALLHLTRLGKALRAMSVEPRLARTCGIPTSRIVMVTWLLSGFLAGIAGVVYVINTGNVSASSGTDIFALMLAAAILGQPGSLGGTIIASLLVGFASELVSAYGGSAYSTVAGFGILLVVLLARPSNVGGATAQRVELTV